MADVENNLLPMAERDVEELRKYYGPGSDEPVYVDALKRRQFYQRRIKILRNMIETAKIING